ncbi:MAG: hypothetical protein EOQ46_26325 [Mesorhizobium sp.]|uniref:hypothetical protein n=1 Tax=Mesorhizobium sp. TaxID=1871066 RepID=UPI000FEA8DB6|nr:hypothetical protein [Mesorhizobium sp.]RWB39754.1 MAG: hypothetical protein EOQ46_26325 [Mesorhizobium sp.]
MATKTIKTAKLLSVIVIAAGIVGCGTVKEKTAPCKRAANLTSYAADPRQDCGRMASINGDPSAAFAAIDAMVAE